MTQIEELLKKKQELEELLIKNGISFKEENEIPSYRYSKINYKELQSIVEIKESFEDGMFDVGKSDENLS